MSNLQWGVGIFPAPRLFIKVDKVVLSMYNEGLEVMPMEFIVFGIIAAGIICGVMEQSTRE